MRRCDAALSLLFLQLQLVATLRAGQNYVAPACVGAPAASSAVSRRTVVATAAAAALTLGSTTAATASDVADAGRSVKSAIGSLSKPGLEIEYMETMDRDTGELRRPVKSVNMADPVGGPLLLFGAAATRLGGILPDEMPFNIVQKLLRGVLPYGWFPDLADNDFRKDYQDTWYGTNQKAEWLPEFMRSRPNVPPAERTAAAAAAAQAEAERQERLELLDGRAPQRERDDAE